MLVPLLRELALVLLFMCCHPALTLPSAIALTLRAVGGLTTADIAAAFLVPEATMAQRISRAKQKVKESGAGFQLPGVEEWPARLRAVLHVLYLVFNEGYTASSGAELVRSDPLDEQDRGLWDQAAIDEGVDLVTGAMGRGAIGPYQLQAAIAALHDEPARAEDTDWSQILALYSLLERMTDNPMVTLNRAIAIAMVHGPRAGLERVDALEQSGKLEGHHRLHAVRAHLLERAGDRAAARAAFERAATMTASEPEQRYLRAKAAKLADDVS